MINHIREKYKDFIGRCKENNVSITVSHEGIILDHEVFKPEMYVEKTNSQLSNQKIVDCFIFPKTEITDLIYISVELKSTNLDFKIIKQKIEDSHKLFEILLKSANLLNAHIKFIPILVHKPIKSSTIRYKLRMKKSNKIKFQNKYYELFIYRAPCSINDIINII